MKKIINWLFGKNLEIPNRWWYRLLKVIVIGFWLLVVIVAIGSLMFEPPIELLRKHNITIKTTLLDYTKNYNGNDYDFTISKFFEEKGEFGALINNKMYPVSKYALEGSLCVKSPEKYLNEIAIFEYNVLDSNLKDKISLTSFSEIFKENFTKNPDRKCFMNLKDEDLKKEFGLGNFSISDKIINYHPNFIYYVEALLIVVVGAFVLLVLFVIWSVICYRIGRYIKYGKK